MKLAVWLGRIIALLLLFCAGTTASFAQGAPACGDVYPNASFGYPPGSFSTLRDQSCYVEWSADTMEQERDLLKHCQNRTGQRYMSFQTAADGIRLVCIFKATPDIDPLAQAVINPEDSRRLNNIPALVAGWTDVCARKDRAHDKARSACWLDAAKAIQIYASDAQAPLANEIRQLQMAWLQRAYDLLLTTIELRSAPAPTFHEAKDPPAPPDPLHDELPHDERFDAQVEVKAAMKTTVPLPTRLTPSPLKPAATPKLAAPEKIKRPRINPTKTKTGQSKSRKKPTVVVVAEPNPSAPKPKALRKSAQVALAARKQRSRPVVFMSEPGRKVPFLVKTSTTSKCFQSAEWC